MARSAPNKNLLERIRRHREMQGLRDAILPVKANPYSCLHTPGSLPFWMQADARGAHQCGGEPLVLRPDQSLRLLQDTGSDILLFLSSRGLEYRAFYRLPLILAREGARQHQIFHNPPLCQAEDVRFRSKLVNLDYIPWASLVNEDSLSNHEKLQHHAEREACLDPNEAMKAALGKGHVTVVQTKISDQMVHIGGAHINIDRSQDGRTTFAPHGGRYVHYGIGFITHGSHHIRGAVRDIDTLVGGFRLRDHFALWRERKSAERADPTPIPFIQINLS